MQMSQIEIIEKEIGNVIEIEEKIPMWKMPFFMKKNYKRIMDYIDTHNKDSAGIVYARYLNVDWESLINKSSFRNFIDIFIQKWHFCAGISTSLKLEDHDNIKSNFIQNKKYVKIIHYGDYRKLSDAYKELYRLSKEQSILLKNESIEIYMNDPKTTKKEDLETTILVAIKE